MYSPEFFTDQSNQYKLKQNQIKFSPSL